MPDRIATTDPEGVDFTWVMQTTFVLTILVGAPTVALASIPVSLPTWAARASFAIRVGAIVWLVVAIGAFLYARRAAEGGSDDLDPEARPEDDREGNDRDRNRGSSGTENAERTDESTASMDAHSPSSERSSET